MASLAERLSKKVLGGHTTLRRWVAENYDQIVTAMPGPRRDWKALAEAAVEDGLTDRNGSAPSPAALRSVFQRVQKARTRTALEAPQRKPTGRQEAPAADRIIAAEPVDDPPDPFANAKPARIR